MDHLFAPLLSYIGLLFLAVTFYAPKHTFIKVDYNRLTATVSFINPFLNIILSTDKITWKKYTYMYT